MPAGALLSAAHARDHRCMRYEATAMSLSWIPSEAIGGAMRMPFDAGFTHYDEPPPDHIEDIEKLREADRFRFANVLRAWVDVDGNGKVELTDFKDWYSKSPGKHTPWGDEESPALVTAVETALERALSTRIMRGGKKPKVKKVSAGKLLAEQGAEATELYLVLDGVVRI